MPTVPNPQFHTAVAAELDRQKRIGYSPEHDDEMGVDHLLEQAFEYISNGMTVKGGALIIAARAYIQRNYKNSFQRDIEKFMTACDQEVKKYPALPTEDIRELRIKLMTEELLGAINPSAPDAEKYGLIESKSDELIASMLKGDIVGVADGLADVIYVVVGTAAAYGIDLQEVFNEVQRSNMTKAVYDEETKTYSVIKNEYGKILKPESFSAADLEHIVNSQIERGKAWEEFYSDQGSDVEMVVEDIRS